MFMAAQKKQQEKDEKKAQQKGAEAKQANKPVNRAVYAVAAAVVIIAIAALGATYYNSGTVPFSTFRSAFQSAPRVAVVETYYNQTQLAAVSPCASLVVESIAHSRKASTIDFFAIDAGNGTCTYQQSLGTASPQYANASYCANLAGAEPSISLNYSQSNITRITPSRISVYGDPEYMAQCPIQVELS